MITEKYLKEQGHCLPKKGLRADAPRLYKPSVVKKICNLLIKGESTNKICKRKGMPSRVTLGKWLRKYPEFAIKFLEAKQIQTYFNVDDVRDIADDCDGSSSSEVMKAKLRVDTLKWEAARMLPKIYGDKASLDIRETEEVTSERMEAIVGTVLEKLNRSLVLPEQEEEDE